MSAGRRTAALLVAAGLVAAGAGAAGLVLTRHPDVPQAAALQVLPAPTGPIEAAPPQGAAQVAEPVSLVIPSIGVSTSLVHLGLTSSGALQVPPTTAVAGWYTGSPRPGSIGSAVIAGPHRLRFRAGGLLPALPAAARRPGVRAARGRDARGLRGDRGADVREGRLSHRRPCTARFPTRNCGSSPAAGPSITAPGRTSATRSSTQRKSADRPGPETRRESSVLPRLTRAPATTLVTWPVTSTFTRTTRSRA